MLFNEQALRKRHDSVYARIRERAKPKVWKRGKHAGHVRVPGVIGLPFTREQFWQHALKLVGEGAIRCPYCEEIGRPANLIDLTNCVWDHVIPVARGGPHTLDNLRPCCQDCNNLKGKLTLEFFIGIMHAVENWPDATDRANFYACLRTHGQALTSFQRGRKPQPSPDPNAPSTGVLALQEDF